MTVQTIIRGVAIATTAIFITAGCGLFDSMDGKALQHELEKTGQPATAVVLKISETGMSENDDPVVLLNLEVQPDGQPPFDAQVKCLISMLDVPHFQPGCKLPVHFDPKDHSRVGVDFYK